MQVDLIYKMLAIYFKDRILSNMAGRTIRSTLDNKKYGYVVFADLQKAFHSVHHNILLSKLEQYELEQSL